MGEVYLDGEKVDFQGNEPTSVGEVWNLIFGHLSGQGRSIDSVSLDGNETAPEALDADGGYETLSFRSVSAEEQLAEMCARWASQSREEAGKASTLAAAILRKGWNEGQAEVIAFLEGLRPLLEGLGVAQSFGAENEAPWLPVFTAAFEAGVKAIDQVADALQAREVVALSDALAGDLSQGWQRLAETIEREVAPRLEEGAGQ